MTNGWISMIPTPWQSMLAYGTGIFIKAGIPLTIAGYLLILLVRATYWKWLGLL